MKPVNISINLFIKKLKDVDVVELLEKAQSIKVEDIQKFKFSDFRKSNAFNPFIGLLSAFIFTSTLLVPSIKQTRIYRDKSKLYISEFNQMPFLLKRLNNLEKLQIDLKKEIEIIDELVAKNADLIDFPILIEKTSKISNVLINEYRPVTKQEMESICLLGNNDNRITKVSNNNQRISSTNFNNFISNKNNIAVDPFSFKVDKKRLNNLFKRSFSEIGQPFKSNYFFIEVQSTFKDSLIFLKNMQDYKLVVLPICSITNISNFRNLSSNVKNNGTVLSTKFLFNYPTK